MAKRPLKTLERVLSKAGLGSRVDARRWIHDGRINVNGTIVRNPDQWVDMQRDRVRVDGRPLVARERVYLLLYKPTGYITSYKDPQGRPTVYDLIADVGTFVSPVGRLDLDTSGLLLMTNDNQLAERVTNPDSHVPKTYLVKASTRLTDGQLQQLAAGIELADGPTRPANVIPGSPVPLARSSTCIPTAGRAYSTKASVTGVPKVADFAFHFSEATSRYCVPHAGSESGFDVMEKSEIRRLSRRHHA